MTVYQMPPRGHSRIPGLADYRITGHGGVDDAFTKSLLHFDDIYTPTLFLDESGKTWTPTSASIVSTQSKFGGASGVFTGTTSYVDTPAHADFNVGTGEFTIDFWMYPASLSGYHYVLGQCDSTGTVNSNFFVSIYIGSSTTAAQIGYGTSFKEASMPSDPTLNTWCHIAVVRYVNDLAIYRDGTAGVTHGDLTGITVNSSIKNFTIGRRGENEANDFIGYIDEFRFSKGVARWTTNFTPPTVAY